VEALVHTNSSTDSKWKKKKKRVQEKHNNNNSSNNGSKTKGLFKLQILQWLECCLEQEVETRKQQLATTSAGQLRNSSDSTRPRESAKNKHTKIKNKKIKK
jgi:hypothetical protein